MEAPQLIAATVAGILAPFIQEILFGSRVGGRWAVILAAAFAFVLSTLAFWATGGFANATAAPAFNLVNPRDFFEFWFTLIAPVFGISQFVYNITTKRSDSPPATGPIQSVADKVTEVAPSVTGG